MAKNYLSVNRSTTPGGTLLNEVSQLAKELSAIHQVKLSMDNMTDGVDFTVIEAQFGLAAGQGTLLYSLVSTFDTAAQGSVAVQNLINFLGTVWA